MCGEAMLIELNIKNKKIYINNIIARSQQACLQHLCKKKKKTDRNLIYQTT